MCSGKLEGVHEYTTCTYKLYNYFFKNDFNQFSGLSISIFSDVNCQQHLLQQIEIFRDIDITHNLN